MIQFTPVGDSGVLAVCGSEISEQVNAQVMALDAAVQAAQLPGVVETVPTYAALLVTLDPLQTDADTLIPALRRLWDALPPVSSTAAGRLVEVPVCYGGDYGPDLAFVAQHAGLTEQQVIDIHCGRDYRIFMLGFLPGFPYLGGMDERIVCPRLQTPRTKIPAGAVGVGGKQTGIYPLASPGGWQLIGRTPLRLFDPAGGGKLPYAAGDRIRFVPISPEKFETIQKEQGGGTVNLHVISPGPLTTVQDAGRTGYAARGSAPVERRMVTLCGPPTCWRATPQAAGAAVLEMTLQGGKYQFDGDAVFCPGGGRYARCAGWPPGARLYAAFGPRGAGAGNRRGPQRAARLPGRVWRRGYPPVLGSRSTDLKCRMGGLDGRTLKAGDVLPIGAAPAMVEQRWQQICAKGANRPLGTARTPRKAVALFGRAEAAAVPCGARPPDRCLYRSGAGRICTRGICFDSRL